jgi:cytosine/adenosine deaminase-related metal-dependent hydrolase
MALEDRAAAAAHFPSLGVSPHAPYTISPSLLRMLVMYAKRRNQPVAMHLAESEEELQLLDSGSGPFQELLGDRSMWDATAIPPSTRPLTYLRMLAESPRSLVIHGNYLDHAEFAFLAEHADRMSLIHCPRTHAYFAHPQLPLAALLKNGVHVAIGTDSRASNPDLSMLGEIRHLAHAHQDVAPDTILRMATLSAAEALGRADGLGSITPGKLANLVALPVQSGLSQDSRAALERILTSAEAPAKVWLHGQ